jgi:hypothetical protein
VLACNGAVYLMYFARHFLCVFNGCPIEYDFVYAEIGCPLLNMYIIYMNKLFVKLWFSHEEKIFEITFVANILKRDIYNFGFVVYVYRSINNVLMIVKT